MSEPGLARPSALWVGWLAAVSAGVMLFGLALVVAPAAARQGFSWLLYADAQRISSFGEDAVRYIELANAVLGAVMFGWGVALLLVVRGPFARGSRLGWQIIGASLAAWFVPDTAFSLWSGFWPNAALNLVFAVLFLVPLVATHRTCREPSG
jgi:hypothetical protein